MSTSPINSTPVTIDNLGIDASRRYALDQKALDASLVKDAQSVTSQTERVVLTPTLSLSREFSIGTSILWAAFSPPKDYTIATFRLFSYQLIPTLGGTEQIQALLDQMMLLSKSVEQDRAQQQAFNRIYHLLQLLERLQKTFDILKARRSQYQQG